MNPRVRAVIVEDEPHARASLREYAGEVEWLTLVGEAADGAEAVRLVDSLQPDLLFLDISLPEASGLEVAERIRHKPEIVFTTAYDQYALAAFEVGALDYLLKPFGRQRFQTMLDRVRMRIHSAVPAPERVRAAFGTPLRRLFARTRDGIVPIDVRTIRHISASGDYVEVHSERGTHLLLRGGAALEKQDDEDRGVRKMFLHAVPPRAPSPAAQELAKLKAKIMSADYRADLDELKRLREDVAQFQNDREFGYLAHYWNGFASWRIAINGASLNMKPEDLKTNLQKAATSFYTSIRLNDDFSDAYAAAAGVNGWLPIFETNDPERIAMNERIALTRALLGRALALDRGNPRALWIEAAPLMFLPPERGGNVARAIEIYRDMLANAERRGTDPSSPLPDWGKPEALMSLAFAHSKQTPPDLLAALEEANAALKLVPEWSYLRNNLIPSLKPQSASQ